MENVLERKEFYQLKYTPGIKQPINKFITYTQQLFVARWMSLSQNKRCFLKHSMGSGKTISALLSAAENHLLYKFLGEGRVIILGFQKETFIKEILSKPELGYITNEEYNKLKSLEKNTTEIGQENYKKYKSYLKKRISDLESGYIKFIGYGELNNIVTENNTILLDIFKNSFVICDEIHNTYNSLQTNTYGKAIRYILDTYPDIKILFMSGTPINNKPSEIIDILNLLLPQSAKPGGKDLIFDDFFSVDSKNIEKLKPGALQRLGELSSGYFSFFINEDVSVMPRKIEPNNNSPLNFITCEYSAQHKKLINSLFSNKNFGLEDHNIFDAYFPLSNTFIYKNSDFILINSEPEEWKQKMRIQYINGTVTGGILHKDNIAEYSTKYYNMLCNLNTEGKILIYHEFINGTGLKLIEQILIVNGVLPPNGVISRNTKCAKCYLEYGEHKDIDEFKPMRYLIMHGDLDKKIIEKNMILYNNILNKDGYEYKFLLGSSMIREGYDFKCIREIWVMHILPHISAYLQLEGRAIRAFSHDALPPEKRTVNIKVFACPDEIERYEPKIINYKIIQEIDRVINQNAIDVSLYYSIIKKSFRERNFGYLPFAEKPRVTHINTNTYNVFYGNWEVEEIKKIIASLFVITPAWTYSDLWEATKNPPFEQVIDCTLFSENNFILALGDMIYGYLNFPIIKEGVGYKICCVKNNAEYFVIYPLSEPTENTIKLEQRFGIVNYGFLNWLQKENITTEINEDITTEILNLNTNYAEMKLKFIEKFKDTDMLDIPISTEIYGINFHIRLIEEAISYIFNILTTKDIKSEFHEFYFKIIHFYNKLDIILYADALIEPYSKLYEKYVDKPGNTNTLLISKISNSSMSSSISSFNISEINKFLENTQKVASNILPVGHFLTPKVQTQIDPRLYLPSGWFVAKNFDTETNVIRENDIIIGYYERTENSIDFKFKLRNPVHLIKVKNDKREIELGMVCDTRKKEQLLEIAKKLNISVFGTNKQICNTIKIFLLHAELKDRKKFKKGKVPERTKWCYLPFEKTINIR